MIHSYSPDPVERSQELSGDHIHKNIKVECVLDCTGTEVYLRLNVFSCDAGRLASTLCECITWVT